MKKLLLLTLLCSAAHSFCLNQSDDHVDLNESDKKVGVLLTSMINAQSKEECKKIGLAYYDLFEACDTNECTVTNESSKEILRKHDLVDAEGNPKKGTCQTLHYIKNNPRSLQFVH